MRALQNGCSCYGKVHKPLLDTLHNDHDTVLSSLCDCMQAHGSVLSCRVLYDHGNRSKQVAFVQMETHQQAVRSVEALHGMQAWHRSRHASDLHFLCNFGRSPRT